MIMTGVAATTVHPVLRTCVRMGHYRADCFGREEEKDLSESSPAFLRKRYGRVWIHWNYHPQDLSP